MVRVLVIIGKDEIFILIREKLLVISKALHALRVTLLLAILYEGHELLAIDVL